MSIRAFAARLQRLAAAGILAMLLGSAAGHAQDAGAPDGDPPDRVARLSYLAGRMQKRRYADPSSPLAGLI